MTDQASFTGVHLLTLMRQYKAVRREARLLATGEAVRHDGQQALLAALCAADGIVEQLELAWGNVDHEGEHDGRV